MKIVIIGSGNVATALAGGIACAGLELVAVVARNREKGVLAAVATVSEYVPYGESMPEAEVYIIAVSDGAIGRVSEELEFPEDAVVAHTAGAVGIDALSVRIKNRAVLYPFQTFTLGRKVDFSEVPFFIEGATPEAEEMVSSVAEKLSQTVLKTNSQQREKIHLAGAFACNFVNRLYGIGGEILNDAGLSYNLLKPLIAETAAKAITTDNPAKVQTGAAVRGDEKTIEKHLKIIEKEEIKENIYKNLSKDIWEISKKI